MLARLAPFLNPTMPPPDSSAILVVNTGSSSLKLSVLAADETQLLARNVDDWTGDVAPIASLIKEAPPLAAVGHRVVHGGTRFRGATRIQGDVLAGIQALSPFAPLHQPNAFAAIRAALDAQPEVPAVACFDTAYHSTLSEAAATYALPGEWRARWPVRRYGFHGLSHAYAARRAEALLGKRHPRVVSCHLGSGASLCASLAGKSIDTTMGFTPLGGLVMQTRSGSIDPGLVLWLIEEAGLAPKTVREGLLTRSGLAGLAGHAGDMRAVLAAREPGHPDQAQAELAFEIYMHSLTQHIAGMCASLGGLDALVFTGGIGEHAPVVRAAAAQALGFLGIALDDAANVAAIGTEANISAAGAAVQTLVIPAREDLEIARETRAVLSPPL
jgi:acetate kinase